MLELPKDWRLLPLAELVRSDSPIVYGIVQAGPEHPGGVPYIKSSDVGGAIDPGGLSRTAPEIAAKYQRSFVKPGDIVFSLRGNIGELSIVPDSLPTANLTQGTARICVNGIASNEFIAYTLASPALQRRITTVGKGSTFREISLEELRKLEVWLPPLPEQRKIAEILRTWDEAIDACERLIEQKQRRLDGIRQRVLEALRPGARPDLSDDWDEVTIGSIFTETSRTNPGLGPDDVITVGKYAIRRQVEHFTRSVASANLDNYQLLEPGDFVYDPMSAYYGALGRYTGHQPGIVSPAYRVICLGAGINPEFAEALLKSHYIAFELENRSSQGNREGKRRTLRRDEFASVPLMLPPRSEQDRIAAIIGEVRRELELTVRAKDALATQKRGLMQKLLMGEWRVNV